MQLWCNFFLHNRAYRFLSVPVCLCLACRKPLKTRDIYGSGGRDRTDPNTIDFQWVAGLVSARASGEAFEVGHLAPPDRLLLARVVDAWPRLHGSLKLAILAIVEAQEKG